jgi:pentose-5-phosphate-3-epimerase
MIDLYNKRGPDDKVAQNSKKRVQNTMDEAQRRLNILHNAIQAAKICPVCIDGGIHRQTTSVRSVEKAQISRSMMIRVLKGF